MKAQTNSIGKISLFFEPLNVGGAIGMGDGENEITLEFDNPNQIEYLIHGLNELSNLIAEKYSEMDESEEF